MVDFVVGLKNLLLWRRRARYVYIWLFSRSIPSQISVELWITHILDDATQCYSFFSLISSKNVMNSVMIHNSCVISRFVVQFAMRMWSHFSKDSTSFIPLFCVHIFFFVCEKPFQTHKKLWIEPWISLFVLLFQRQSFFGMHWKQLSLWICPLIQQQYLNSISFFSSFCEEPKIELYTNELHQTDGSSRGLLGQ